MVENKLFTASSFSDLLGSLVIRIAAVIALGYVLIHFNENPTVISIIAVLCVLLIVFIGEEHLSVYPDRIVQQNNSIVSLFYKGKGVVYKIADIKSASLQPPPTAEEIGVAVLLTAVLPKHKNRDTATPIFLELKDGSMVQLRTELDQDRILELVKLINSLARNNRDR